METLWFCLVALMIALYVVLDGFDLGAGALHLWVARGERDRRLVLRSIGPFWDGNEVWLLAAGGTIYFAFPTLYASSFSGFYLPLMIVLWLLMLRGVAVEFRSHLEGPVWRPFWDAVFSGSSALLAVFFGAALGNVVRGVPLDAQGHFFEPLWTDFTPRGQTGILDWYTVVAGLGALAAVAAHGGLWLALKTGGALQERSRRAARFLWWVLCALVGLLTFLTFRVQPQVPARLSAAPWGWVFPALAVAGLIGMRAWSARGRDGRAFLSSCAALAGLLASAAFGLYPYVLPSTTGAAHALTVTSAAAPAHGLEVGLVWWIPGMILAAAYFTYTYRLFAGKVRLESEGY